MRHWKRVAGLVSAIIVPAAALASPWSDDMRDQPSVKPQQAIVEQPENSVPVSGREFTHPPRDVAELVRARLRAAALANPVAADDYSLGRGESVYATHCQACHGANGAGDGPVGLKYVPQPTDLTIRYIQNQPDGQIFYTITHGSVIMPFYRDAISVEDRWHLVNYLKNALGDE